jgi:hypothetical protein
MTELLDERRPAWVVPAPGPANEDAGVIASVTVAGQPATMWFEISARGETWVVNTSLEEIERFLTEIEDGLASSVQMGPELAQVEQGADDVSCQSAQSA